jgi:SM-20-related protein
MHPPVRDLEQGQFEALIQGLIDQGFGSCDGFLDEETISGLRNQLLILHKENKMFPAGIGKNLQHQINTLVRGDLIRWLDPESENIHERNFLQKIERFTRYLNQTCFTNIRSFEFHYAYYERNSFYKRHIDQFKYDSGRKYSLVLYLNEDWHPSDGGSLSLYLPDGTIQQQEPIEGRAVLFKSDKLEHEVRPSTTRFRLSVAGWLKN